MAGSIRPEALKTGKAAAAGGSITALAAAIIYAVVQLTGPADRQPPANAAQATRDLKQDMEIQYLNESFNEIKTDIKEIKRDQRTIARKIDDITP